MTNSVAEYYVFHKNRDECAGCRHAANAVWKALDLYEPAAVELNKTMKRKGNPV